MTHLPDCFRVEIKYWYLASKFSILQLVSFPFLAESVGQCQNPRTIQSVKVAIKIEDEEHFLSCIQQLQELTGIGQSVSQSVRLRVTLFCHNLNLRIDLRIDPANQK